LLQKLLDWAKENLTAEELNKFLLAQTERKIASSMKQENIAA